MNTIYLLECYFYDRLISKAVHLRFQNCTIVFAEIKIRLKIKTVEMFCSSMLYLEKIRFNGTLLI